MGVNKKINGDIEDIFDDNFEVTYEDDIILEHSELNMDPYKDVLSVLNELDETGSMDYLEANRTKTIDLGNYFDETGRLANAKKEGDPHAKHKGLSSYFGDIFKKHD